MTREELIARGELLFISNDGHLDPEEVKAVKAYFEWLESNHR